MTVATSFHRMLEQVNPICATESPNYHLCVAILVLPDAFLFFVGLDVFFL